MSKDAGEINRIDTKRFSEMNGAERSRYLGRVLGFLATMGFLFPNAFID